jgi:NADH-quinone oxidoreductase subunit M
MSPYPLLTIITLIPLAGGGCLLCLPRARAGLARALAVSISLLVLALAVLAWLKFDSSSSALQLDERYSWVRSLGIFYHVGIDGLGLLMLMLSAIVVPMALLASWNIQHRAPLYFGLVLLLQCGLIGTFTALNFFHWFIYWELSLVPAFFLVRLWGGGGRVEAATQFFVYTMAGSVALLLGFLAIYAVTGSFDFMDLADRARSGALNSALAANLGWYQLTARHLVLVIFSGVFIGFAVKVPLMPLHTWLPATYSEASTGTTMLLTGVMSKMGVYGFLRILVPLFPEEVRWVQTPLLWLAVLTIVMSAGAALAQTDLKRVLAYSSINHLGYCLLGLFAAGSGVGLDSATALQERASALSGVLLQMFNHGVTAAALFWFAGMIEERSGGCRDLNDFGGLRKTMPVFCGLMGIALFSSLGLPGLNGFIGEFLIFKGVFPLAPWAAALSTFGLLLTAVFILNVLQRIFYGPPNEHWSKLPDLTVRERWLLAPALVLMLVLGVYPQLVLGAVNRTVLAMAQNLNF